MKILYALNSGSPGGMEQHVLDLTKAMVQQGHEVYIWCRDGDIVAWLKREGAIVTTISINFELDPVYIIKLALFLRNHKIDVVHSHELKASANALLAGFFAKTPVRISHIHTPMSEWIVTSFIKKLYTRLTIFCYSLEVNLLAHAEIALTESRKQIKITEGIRSEKLVIIPNAVDTSKAIADTNLKISYKREIFQRFNIPEDAFLFGVVSRLTREKGHTLLIKAFKEFLSHSGMESRPVYLMLAGGGILEDNLRELLRELGLTTQVIITGVFKEEDKIRFYSALDVFVFPTLAEGFGIVLIEAMYNSLPIICSDLEVLQEVGGSTMLYFETGSVRDLAQKMFDTYIRKDNLEHMTSASRQRVLDLYTMDKFSANYIKLYQSLLERVGKVASRA